MSDIAQARYNIQTAEVQYEAAISEATFNKIGGAINFINNEQFKHFEFGFLKAISPAGGSPTYNLFTPSSTVISDVEAFPNDSEIVGICLVHNTSGSSGTTTLRIEWSAQNSGTWATIFSTNASVTSAAPTDAQFDTFGNATTPTGCTVPVISVSTFLAGTRLRCVCTAVQAGTPNGFLMKVYYRPI